MGPISHKRSEERDRTDGLIARVPHKSKRRIEELIADLAPKPDVPARVRKLPQPRAAQTPAAELRPGDAPG